MGGENIKDEDLVCLNIIIVDTKDDGDRMLKIPKESLPDYFELIKSKLTAGFWNEVVGEKEILFIFKHKDGSTKEYKLSPENEQEVDNLCNDFNEVPHETGANIYKYISNNSYYHDFMIENYGDIIRRN